MYTKQQKAIDVAKWRRDDAINAAWATFNLAQEVRNKKIFAALDRFDREFKKAIGADIVLARPGEGKLKRLDFKKK